MGPHEQILTMTPARSLGGFPASGSAASTTEAAELFTEVLQGPSVAATHLRAQIRRVGPYFRTASLTGENGCGEEQVARALHAMSPVRGKGFVTLGPREAEERFGPGADVRGLMREGMVYLAESGRLSVAAQRGLMRALRERDATSARVVAFVGRGLRPLISAGMFSVELAGALAALRVSMPTLRERSRDIPLLLRQMFAHEDRRVEMSDEFLQAASGAAWPGNLEQMREVVRWLAQKSEGTELRGADLQEAFEALRESGSRRGSATRMVRLDQVVQEHVLGVLVGCNGNKLRAAEVLGISRSTLYRMLEGGAQGNVLAMAG